MCTWENPKCKRSTSPGVYLLTVSVIGTDRCYPDKSPVQQQQGWMSKMLWPQVFSQVFFHIQVDVPATSRMRSVHKILFLFHFKSPLHSRPSTTLQLAENMAKAQLWSMKIHLLETPFLSPQLKTMKFKDTKPKNLGHCITSLYSV